MKKTSNKIIAFFDIMGFKNLVQNKSHGEILKKMQKLSDYVNGIDSKKFEAYNSSSEIRTIIFSDSVIIISDNDTAASAVNVTLHSSYLMNYCFQIGMPIKGSIAFGKLTADFEKSLFFGQPLIDAYLLQEELNLYSIIIHHSFEAKFRFKKYGGGNLSDLRWFKYKTPLKGGLTEHYHVNWLFYELYNYQKNVRERDEKKNKYLIKQIDSFYSTVSGRPRIYVDNTLKFIHELIEITTPNKGLA